MLNQYQECDIDGLMERTRGRPLPSGRCRAVTALILSLALILSAFVLLALFFGTGALIAAMASVFLYNVVYTPLKRKTIFALYPGLLCGALPPLLGAMAAEGIVRGETLALMGFLFLWQLPHFWLHGHRYRMDYVSRGPLPGIGRLMLADRGSRVAFIWILASGTSSLLIPLFCEVTAAIKILLLLSAAALVLPAFSLMKHDDRGHYGRMIAVVNTHALAVMMLLLLNSLTVKSFQ